MPVFLLKTKPLVRVLFCVLCLTFISAYTSSTYADSSDMRANLERKNELIIQALIERGELSGDAPDPVMINTLRTYVANIADDQLEKTLADIENGLASLEKEIAQLKASPQVAEDAKGEDGDVENLRSQFYELYSRCSNIFKRYKKSSVIFKSSPCSEYEDRVESRIWNADGEREKIVVYQEGVTTLGEITTKMAETESADLERIYEQVKSFNARHAKLQVLAAERESIKQSMAPIIENMNEYQAKAESYMDDANLNCRAEPVDFDCGNRCEKRVKDPIFGTYRNEPDRQCLESCNYQERRATDDLNEQIDECIDERDWAKEKLEDIESKYNSERARGLALSNQHDQINDELKLLIDRNKEVVVELDSFLGKLPPDIFYAMSGEFGMYGVNSTSYRSD
tara:strand:+ start:247 stop:1440 length:1194 start_codon:yes stop_codon:yes gene_type:complete